MKVSSAVEINDNAVQFSSSGKYLAYGCKNSLNIINVNSLEIVSTFHCSHSIKKVDWNWDSDHLLCVLSDVRKVEAFSVTDPEWGCVIKEGNAGVETALWSPIGYHILTLTTFNVRISVWSLKGQTITTIENPILKKADLSFSKNGSNLAVITGSRPVTLSKLKPTIKAPALPGISNLACDNTGKFIATQCSSMPAVVWLWNAASFSLKSVVILSNAVASLNWSDFNMLISSRGNSVVLWTPKKPLLLDLSPFVYEGLCVEGCLWRPKTGDKILVVTASFIYIASDFNH
ncbi:UNVERIFIED_CONTAM: hypothetical protein PYX00_006280 [Menopon gallinae]|uniref:WD repeat-containing protein WRAP73 n=1 Tax=Menopon gallinae TaxID=328185 RepID=A0AAW2HWM2_9NEOP